MKAESGVTTDIVKAPEQFKKDTKWKSWRESVVTYLHSKTGQAGVPLAAILRDNELPVPGAIYATTHDELVECSILVGPEFAINNGAVYDLLHSLTLNGPAWSWVQAYQRTRNGRAAWKALLGYYEGDSMQTRSKQEAYNSISAANYVGPRRGFDINTYTTIHQQAHQDLLCFDEPVPKNKKVRDYLQGITDPQCSVIKLAVLSNSALLHDFWQTINYVGGAIDLMTKNASQVAAVEAAADTRIIGEAAAEVAVHTKATLEQKL